MIAANTAIFTFLDDIAASRGGTLENAGQPRWIATEAADRDILKNAALARIVRLGPTRTIARFDHADENTFVLVGFDPAADSSWLTRSDVGPGLLTAALAEVRPSPRATALQIKQVVDAQDDRDEDYVGHDASLIADLFPSIISFSGKNIDENETDRIVFDFVISETSLSDNWVSDHLCDELHQLSGLTLTGVPYMTVARSMLDFDPASLFMGLYRTLESLYAYAGANRLRSRLMIDAPWSEIAAALETEVNWRPIEWQSLEVLMQMGAEKDLLTIRDSIRPAFPGDAPADLVRSCTEYVYKLRNSVVHFRPAYSSIDHNLVQWEDLCESMVTLVAYVYSDIFETI